MRRYGTDYDYGLRGYRQTGGMRGDPRGRGYDAGHEVPRHRVTARYNRDYVRPEPDRYRRDHASYAGGYDARIGDFRSGSRPYLTVGGSRTWRGGTQPMGWEWGRGYGRDYPGPVR